MLDVLDMLGAEGDAASGATLGSKYYDKATAGDGTEIRPGSRVVFRKGRRSPFAYSSPDPPEGAVGRVLDGIHEFRKEIWVPVDFPDTPPRSMPLTGKSATTYDVRVRELRSADAPAVKPAPTPSAASAGLHPAVRTLPVELETTTRRAISPSLDMWAGGAFAVLALVALAQALEWV